MKTVAVTLLASFLLTIGQAGCSSKQEAESDSTVKVEAKAPAKEEVTPAAKRFPIRDENNKFVTVVTDFGSMTIELYRDVAPAHADSFVARTMDGFYSGTIFHRIIKGFMIQGGDPLGTGMGNAGYYLPAEFSKLPHQEGTLSMARSRSPNSASSQFFICLTREGCRGLDGQYTVFGQLIKGYDVLHALAAVPVVPNPQGEMSKPEPDIYLRKVFISDAEGNQPEE